MGQKVSPTGFRMGITEDWRSRWYADKDYAKNLENDMAIRKFLDKRLARAAVSKVEIGNCLGCTCRTYGNLCQLFCIGHRSHSHVTHRSSSLQQFFVTTMQHI